MDGIFLILKPAGITSFGVIAAMRQTLLQHPLFPIKKSLPKLGHGGTLDPFATGLLIVLMGKATKLSSQFLESVKTYQGVMTFGIKTDTGDLTGKTIQTTSHHPNHLDQLEKAAAEFVQLTPYWQTPPMFSAKNKVEKSFMSLLDGVSKFHGFLKLVASKLLRFLIL